MIKNKFNGYSGDGRRLYPAGGGGATQSTSYQTNIPEYARPYVEQMLGATQRQLFTGTTDAKGQFTPTGFNEYMPYGATYQTDAQGNPMRDAQGRVMYTNTAQQQAQAAVAGLSPLQQQAMMGLSNYVAPQQGFGASQIAGDVAGRSAASGYYSPLQAERFQLGRPQQVRTDSFVAPGVSQAYMSPYMQNVVNAQQREAQRQAEIMRNQNQAQAVQQGAFGGSRQAIVEAERQRNLATQLGDIQAQGLQQAYGQGMGQFNAEQQAYLAAQQANQGANLQAAIQNLQSQQAAQAAQEQSRQFGANLGLQGYGQALQGAQLLGQQGQQEYQQDMGTLQAQLQAGGLDQAQQQAVINQAIQNYATQQQYPLMQLGVMSNMLRGLPMEAANKQMYQAQPSTAAQLAGAVGTGLTLYQQGKTAGVFGQKEGGVVKMAAGGIATGVPEGKLQAMVKGFADKDITGKMQDPETDAATKEVMAAEMARRQRLREGMPKMAAGGIVAFKKGKRVKAATPDKSAEKAALYGDEGYGSTGIMAEAPTAEPVDTVEAEAPAAPTGSPDKAALYSDAGYGGTSAPTPAAPAVSADPEQALMDQQQKLLKYQEEQGGIMGKKPADIIRERAEAREAQGLASPYGPEKEKIAQRRLEAAADVKEQAKDNLIKFLTRWGTLPGPTLVAMNRAGVEMIEQSEMDKKTQRKLLDQLNASENEINRAEYLRRIGEEDKAQEVIQKAGVEYYKVGKEIIDNTVKLINAKANNEAKTEIAKLQRELAEAKGASSSDYKVRLKTIADRLRLQKDFANAPEAVIMEAADRIVRGHEISKSAAGAAQSVPVKEREAATRERTEATKTAKEVESMVDEAVDRDPGKRAAKAADRKSGTSTEMDKLRKKHEDAIRAKISGGSTPEKQSGSGKDYSNLWK